MKQLLFISAALLAVSIQTIFAQDASQDGFIPLFDGKTLDGWERVGGDDTSKWAVENGAMVSGGKASMLVYTKGPYKNFRYRTEVKINDKGNSGLYFRTTRKPTFSDGHEAQINSSHGDPIRTGSLYNFCHVYKRLVEPDTWFKYEIECKDTVWRSKPITQIKVIVNGDELYQYHDFAKTWGEGYFAFQHHDPGSIVQIRKVELKVLPD